MPERSLERRRDALAAFLRQRRETLRPVDVGLPLTGRRRTPGLRREEVATLAGVGLTWYTWLEQGRDINASEEVLLRLSKALKLDDAECCHLFLLAQRRPPPVEAYQWDQVSPRVQQLMDDLTLRPAYVTNLRWDVIAWNAAAQQLLDLEQRPRQERNILHMLFADPALRQRLPQWRDEAPCLLAQFRCDMAATPDDPAMLALVEGLKTVSPDFRRWWASSDLSGYARGFHEVGDAEGRVQQFDHEMLPVDEHRHLRMVVYFCSR